MKLRKILAAVAASAVAVSALAVSAFAADLPTGVREFSYKIDGSKVVSEFVKEDGVYDQVQMGHVSHIDNLTITYTNKNDASDTGYMLIATNWDGDPKVECKNFDWVSTYNSWTGAGLYAPEGTITSANINDYEFTISFTFDCTAYAEDFATYTADGSDPAGIIIANFMCKSTAATSVTVGHLPAAEAGDTGADAGADDKGENNPDTGVEGIAVVAGLAIVATGAIVVAKKRG